MNNNEWKLWIYTNYDCNLRCAYCCANSSPAAPRRALGLQNVTRLVDEAAALGFKQVFFTGGEPFLLEDIYPMLAYASARLFTTVLTNAMLFEKKDGSGQARIERLQSIRNDRLIVQVSLDGARPEHHDAYRGAGTWEATVAGLKLLQQHGFRVRLGTTETPANTAHLHELCEFHRALGIQDEDHIVRPLARRGFSTQGVEIERGGVLPELTANVDGVFWHPLSTDQDMQVSESLFPLAEAKARVETLLAEVQTAKKKELQTFT